MEIRPVEGEGCDPGGYVVELLGVVEFRELRHEACEAAMAILEREVDRLKQIVDRLCAGHDAADCAAGQAKRDGRKTTVVRGEL